ncbi:recombination protein RecR [candidate division KSB1 bacterium]|nr:MAG: recombination protein RecR [candidate division KSB1 bacterium]MBC6947087.1 recombination protein RecR [candidate division KSB1 bacterium]MCE7941509.1 recombination protein RecR [Chlorobi bacterium CHB1]MDL1874738.1 recombination protein RecR [Cytophagia bacterium CHB2]
MQYLSRSVETAVIELSKLPGIGRKTAQRLVFYLLKTQRPEVEMLAQALLALKDNVRHCSQCFNLTESDPCALCANPKREHGLICVVEEANDVLALENTSEYRGLYHVLGGALSPLDGIGPDDLRIRELLQRLQNSSAGISEVILATNPNTEGEATAIYLLNLIKPLGIKVSRLARGLPVGGDLEFTDEVTLSRALTGRVAW